MAQVRVYKDGFVDGYRVGVEFGIVEACRQLRKDLEKYMNYGMTMEELHESITEIQGYLIQQIK